LATSAKLPLTKAAPRIGGVTIKTRISAIWRTAKRGWSRTFDTALWLARAWRTSAIRASLVTALAILAALLFAFRRPITEPGTRLAGVALQVLGTLWGLLAWNSTRRLFKVPSLAAHVRGWWESRPRKRAATIPLQGTALSIAGGRAHLSVVRNMAADLDIAERVDALVANLEQLRKDFDETKAAHETSITQLRGGIDARIRAADSEISGVSGKLREAQTGGLWGALAALFLILVGTVLVGAAPEIRHAFHNDAAALKHDAPTAINPSRGVPGTAAADGQTADSSNHAPLGTCLGVKVLACSYEPSNADHHLITGGEFLALVGLILALRALARPSIEFRLRVAGITTRKMIIVMAVAGVFVLMGELLPYWSGQRWPLAGYSLTWEVLAFLLMLSGSLLVLSKAFGVVKFSRLNARKYCEATTSVIGRGNEDALAELADDIWPSVAKVVEVSSRFDYTAARSARDAGAEYKIGDYIRIAITTLNLWSDQRFCAVMVRRAPASAIKLLDEIRIRLDPEQGGKSCIEEIVNQALTQEDSLLYREEEFSTLGRYRFLTDAISSHYQFVNSDFRPLQAWRWRSSWKANARQVGKYGELLVYALEGYFKYADFTGFPAGLWSAFRQFAELGSRRAWRLRDTDARDVGDDENLDVLYKISDTLEKAIRVVVKRQSALPDYPLDLSPDWRIKDPSIYTVLANAVYLHFESLAQVLAHDSAVRMCAISIWQEIFPISATLSPAAKSIQVRLIELLKKKVEANLSAGRPYYPAITRLLISVIGLPNNLDQLPDEADREFIRWFLETLRDRYAAVVAKHPEIAKDFLPDDVTFDSATNTLVLDSRLRGIRRFDLRAATPGV
jgi:hypothetical protein